MVTGKTQIKRKNLKLNMTSSLGDITSTLNKEKKITNSLKQKLGRRKICRWK